MIALGNLVAFLLLLLSIAFPAWTVRQNSDSTMEYYGVIWSLSRSNISFNVYKIHSMCDGTMDDVNMIQLSGKKFGLSSLSAMGTKDDIESTQRLIESNYFYSH